MPYEPRPNTFVLFRNDKKGNEKAPDYKGNLIDENGAKKNIAAWIKDGKNGKFMSGVTEEPWEKKQGFDADKGTGSDDIPF